MPCCWSLSNSRFQPYKWDWLTSLCGIWVCLAWTCNSMFGPLKQPRLLTKTSASLQAKPLGPEPHITYTDNVICFLAYMHSPVYALQFWSGYWAAMVLWVSSLILVSDAPVSSSIYLSVYYMDIPYPWCFFQALDFSTQDISKSVCLACLAILKGGRIHSAITKVQKKDCQDFKNIRKAGT